MTLEKTFKETLEENRILDSCEPLKMTLEETPEETLGVNPVDILRETLEDTIEETCLGVEADSCIYS